MTVEAPVSEPGHELQPFVESANIISDQEWRSLERRVEVLAKTALVPEQFRKNPSELMVAALGLRDLGVAVGPQTLSQCFVISGRPGYMAQLQIALAARAGWTITFNQAECDATSATVYIGRDDGERHAVTFTWDDAVRAKLDQKDTYKQYPDRMLLARAVTKAIGFYCPHVKLAIDYSSEQAAAVVAVRTARPPANVDPETGEIVDAEIVEEAGKEEQRASTGPGSESDPEVTGSQLADILSRFWAKVDKSGPVPEHRPELGPCWVWTGSTNGRGYGELRIHGRKWYAHRFAFVALGGNELPDGFDLDHLCRTRPCVRPEHLEAVTRLQNVQRGEGHGSETHCPQGHPYAGDNLRVESTATRHCRTCDREGDARRRAQRLEASRDQLCDEWDRSSLRTAFENLPSDDLRDLVRQRFAEMGVSLKDPGLTSEQAGMAIVELGRLEHNWKVEQAAAQREAQKAEAERAKAEARGEPEDRGEQE